MFVYGVHRRNLVNGFDGIKILSEAFNLKNIDTGIKLLINRILTRFIKHHNFKMVKLVRK